MIQGQHHRRMCKEEAIAELRKNQGKQFDEALSEVFIQQILREDGEYEPSRWLE